MFPRHIVVVIDDERLRLTTGEGRLRQVRGTNYNSPHAVTLQQIYLGVRDRVLHNKESRPAVGNAVVEHLPSFRAYSGNGDEASAEALVYLLLEVDNLARLTSQYATMPEDALETLIVIIAQQAHNHWNARAVGQRPHRSETAKETVAIEDSGFLRTSVQHT